jgi:hypothetical protein
MLIAQKVGGCRTDEVLICEIGLPFTAINRLADCASCDLYQYGYNMMADQREKPLLWLGDSRNCVRLFPEVARQRAGFELREVQKGKDPSNWKPMSDVGPGVRELRIQTGEQFRILVRGEILRGRLRTARL